MMEFAELWERTMDAMDGPSADELLGLVDEHLIDGMGLDDVDMGFLKDWREDDNTWASKPLVGRVR